jgi:hypothetical protein
MGNVSDGYPMMITPRPQTKQTPEMTEMMPFIHVFVGGALLVGAAWAVSEAIRQRTGRGGDGTRGYKRRKYNGV